MKEAVKKNKEVLDLSKPIDKSKTYYSNVSCFGKMWDVISRECSICAANEVCAIFMQEAVKKQAVDLEQQEGGFLDMTDFYEVDKKLIKWLRENKDVEVTSAELVGAVKKLAKCRDEVACVLYVKRMVKNTDGLLIKNGKIVWSI